MRQSDGQSDPRKRVTDMSSVQPKHDVPKQDEFSEFFEVAVPEVANNDTVNGSSSDVTDVSVLEAADKLGITVRSVWRRIQKKQLLSRLEHGKTIVSLRQCDVHATSVGTSAEPDVSINIKQTQNTDSAITELLAVVNHLQLKLEAASYRNGYLESAHSAANEQLKALPDYMSKAAQAEIHQRRIKELEKEVEQLRKPFWLRLFVR